MKDAYENGVTRRSAAGGQARRGSDGASRGVWAQLLCLLRALCRSRYRSRLGILALLLFVVVCANTYGQIRLNAWNGSFYDTLEQRSFWALGNELVAFLVIIGGLLSLVVAQTWLQEIIKVRLREWLTHDLLDAWLAPKRAYLLSHAGEIGVNPDQRMEEDANKLQKARQRYVTSVQQTASACPCSVQIHLTMNDRLRRANQLAAKCRMIGARLRCGLELWVDRCNHTTFLSGFVTT